MLSSSSQGGTTCAEAIGAQLLSCGQEIACRAYPAGAACVTETVVMRPWLIADGHGPRVARLHQRGVRGMVQKERAC
jgi:hypothetical protein